MNLLPVGAAMAVAVVALGALAAANRAPDAPAPPPSIAAAARNLFRPRFAQYTPRGRAFARAAYGLMWATVALVVFWFFQ